MGTSEWIGLPLAKTLTPARPLVCMLEINLDLKHTSQRIKQKGPVRVDLKRLGPEFNLITGTQGLGKMKHQP